MTVPSEAKLFLARSFLVQKHRKSMYTEFCTHVLALRDFPSHINVGLTSVSTCIYWFDVPFAAAVQDCQSRPPWAICFRLHHSPSAGLLPSHITKMSRRAK